MKYLPAAIVAAPLLLTLASCGGPPATVDEIEIPGYGTLIEPIAGRNVSPLQGRRIVLDPGHGGFFRGAVGPAGLTEAEVNLGVALHLRGLLEWAGAEVHMTRTSDTDFLTPADSTLAGDLAFRVAVTDSLGPDVFLSIHHNSTAARDPDINETQTYYPLGRGGASLDLARSIHRHLVLNLEITPAKILPGNFHVLRNATVPAVLGEPAMISNPIIEGRLSLAASQRLEAEAYFLGLLDYFAQGSPAWSGAAVDTLFPTVDGGAPSVTWVFDPDAAGGDSLGNPPLDPGSIRVIHGGRLAPFQLATDGRTVSWTATGAPWTTPTWLEITGRNVRGRATPVRRTWLAAATEASLDITVYRTDDDVPLALHWRTSGGYPAAAGHLDIAGLDPIDVSGRREGWLSWPRDHAVPERFSFVAEAAPDSYVPVDRSDVTLAGDRHWSLLLPGDGRRAPTRAVLRASPDPQVGQTAEPLPGPPLIGHRDGPLWVEIPGYHVVTEHGTNTAPGTDLPPTPSRVRRLDPLLPGLLGTTVVIDPAGGGSDPEGTGPLGLRGADLNLDVARVLADMLRGAGVEVHLTRGSGAVPLPEDKIAMADRVGANYFLTIGRTAAAQPATIRHHHGSLTGRRWAERTVDAARPVAGVLDSLAVEPSYAYLLRHTACPALEVRLPGPVTNDDEMRMSQRAWIRAEARIHLMALARITAARGDSIGSLDPGLVVNMLPGAPVPASVDLAVLDGQFTWTPPTPMTTEDAVESLSSWRPGGFPVLDGVHTLEIRSGRTWQLWSLIQPPAAGTPKLLMSGP